MKLKTAIILASILCFYQPTSSDSWMGIGPQYYVCRGANYIAEIFPKNSRIKNDTAVCYFYVPGYKNSNDKYDPPRTYKLLWFGKLVNERAPNAAIISENGYLVTLDEHAHLGYAHSVVVYGKDGRLIKDFKLEDMVPSDHMDSISWSTSSRWWRSGARYFFKIYDINGNENNIPRLYISLRYGEAIRIDLKDGKCKYGDVDDFSDLKILLNKSYPNEESLIWSKPLEFTSITEYLKCQNSK